jgi:hypothetical protein
VPITHRLSLRGLFGLKVDPTSVDADTDAGGVHVMNEIQPIPGLLSDAHELEASFRERTAQLPAAVLIDWTADVAAATARGDRDRVEELTLSMLVTIRLQQNEDYRHAAKEGDRAMEETPVPSPLDRSALFASLRAAG